LLPHFLRFLPTGYQPSPFTRSLHARFLILSHLEARRCPRECLRCEFYPAECCQSDASRGPRSSS
jgi:hypothetical protein